MHTAGPAKGHWKWDHLTAAMKMTEEALARYGRVVLAHLNERPDEGGQVFQVRSVAPQSCMTQTSLPPRYCCCQVPSRHHWRTMSTLSSCC